jgi:hypothetical protein
MDLISKVGRVYKQCSCYKDGLNPRTLDSRGKHTNCAHLRSPKTNVQACALNPSPHFVCTSSLTVRVSDICLLCCTRSSSTIIIVCVHYPKLINQVVIFPWAPALLTPQTWLVAPPPIDLSPNWKVFTLLFVCCLYLIILSAVLSELVPSWTKAEGDVNLLHSFPVTVHELGPLADWPRLRISGPVLRPMRACVCARVNFS